MTCVEQELARRGASRLEVLLAPQAHDPHETSRTMYLMGSRGWRVSQYDLNQSIDVDDRPLDVRMNRANLKRLRKCAREGAVATALAAPSLREVHDVLAANRSARGRTLSMDLAQLTAMQRTFPERVVLFGCQKDGELTASAFCLRVERSVLYVFAWGHRPEHSTSSPVVALAAEIYRYCQENSLRLLDVGTSTVGAEPDLGLLRFKAGLGCTDSLKVRLQKDLA